MSEKVSKLEPTKIEGTLYDSMTVIEWLKPENLQKIEEWAKSGLIIENVAHNMGIATSTFYNWKKKYPEIENAWLNGKLHADTIVLNSFFRAANGYDVEEYVKELNEYGELVITKVTKKHIPANAKLTEKWLNNRLQGAFKDNQLTETYRAKVEAETERIKLDAEKLRLQNEIMKGLSTDTNGMAMLEKLFKGGE